MAWQKGPLPPDTYLWGGVVPVGHDGLGFYFADFCGDHVKMQDGKGTVLQPDEVAWFNNSINPPPGCASGKKGRAMTSPTLGRL